MKWTQTLIPTLREAPADAEIMSHKLLLRAGLIRKLAGGVYTFLPLGLRALRKVEQIVREEMDRAGAVEVLMPALQPPEIWEASGRADGEASRIANAELHSRLLNRLVFKLTTKQEDQIAEQEPEESSDDE